MNITSLREGWIAAHLDGRCNCHVAAAMKSGKSLLEVRRESHGEYVTGCSQCECAVWWLAQ